MMLHSRRIQATLFEETVETMAIEDAELKLVFYPLVWNLVVNKLRKSLNQDGIYGQRLRG